MIFLKIYGIIALANYKKKRDSMNKVKIRDEYITLGQALKLANLVSSGIEAKVVVQDGQVKVNGEIDCRRGKKLRPGDMVEYNGQSFIIE